MFNHILIPTDGSHVANKAAKAGIVLARRLGDGRRGLAGLIMGSVTQKVLAHSGIPVVVFQ